MGLPLYGHLHKSTWAHETKQRKAKTFCLLLSNPLCVNHLGWSIWAVCKAARRSYGELALTGKRVVRCSTMSAKMWKSCQWGWATSECIWKGAISYCSSPLCDPLKRCPPSKFHVRQLLKSPADRGRVCARSFESNTSVFEPKSWG